MSEPTPALTEPTETGPLAAQQTGPATAPLYNPIEADRGPTRAEIEAWRQATYDKMINKAAADGEDTSPGSLAETLAASATGRVYMAWNRITDRAERDGLTPDDVAGLCGRAYIAAITGQEFDAEGEALPSIERAEQIAAAQRAAAETAERKAARAGTAGPGLDTTGASAADQDGDTVEADLVELGVRYETLRTAARDAYTRREEYTKEKQTVEREFLTAMVDSGQASITLIMPGSGEVRVLTPQAKVWPKVKPDPDAPVDEATGERVAFDEAARIAALREAGYGHLIEEKISRSGLNELFDSFTDAEDMPAPLRRVYDLSRQWTLSSQRGRAGRALRPTRDEVAAGRRTD